MAASPPRPKPKGALYGRSFLLIIELACLGMLIGITYYWGRTGMTDLAFGAVCWSIILDTFEIVTLSGQRFRRLPNWALLFGDFASIAMFAPLMFIAYFIIYEAEHTHDGGVEIDPNEGYHLDDPEKNAAVDARIRTSKQLELAESIFWMIVL